MEDEVKRSVSRRSMIKRIGAGTAVVWSAPALTSLGSRAYAQASPGGPPCGPNAPDWTCGQAITECGVPAEPGPCVCDQDVEGNDFCWNNFFCSDVDPCTTSADCPGSQRCVTSCCGTTCAPQCGTSASSQSRARSSSSRATGAGV